MPILDIQSRFRELGRIRTGRKVPTKNNRMRPEKLARFRLTSQWEHLVVQAATVFGGTPAPWDNGGQREYEVIVEVEALPIIIPPGEILEQWYELWSGGGCARRCDGITQVLEAKPCACPKDPIARQELAGEGKACKPTTRLKVMIPDVSDVGIWRLESHGFHAAAELGGSAGLVETATRAGMMIPADLRLQAREGARRPGQPTKKFFVPAISFRGTLGPTLDAMGLLEEGASMPRMLGAEPSRPSLEAGGRGELPPSGTAFDPAPTEAPSFPGGSPSVPAPVDVSEEIPAPRAPSPPPAPLAPEEASHDVSPPEELPPTEAYEPPATPDTGERAYSGPQIIAMRMDERGITAREEKLAIIGTLVEREISSSKDLTVDEVKLTLDVLNNLDAWTELLEEHVARTNARAAELEAENAAMAQQISESVEAPTSASAPEGGPILSSPLPGPSPAPSEQIIDAEIVETTPAPSPGPGPRGWSESEWKTFLRDRGVKVVDLIREAQRLADARGQRPGPHSIATIIGSGLEEELAGYAEENALRRGES